MNHIKKFLRTDLTSVIFPIFILFAALSLTSPGFLSEYNMYSNLQSIPVYAIVGLAQMAVLSLGQMNLAVGSIGCLSGIILGMCLQVYGIPLLPAIAIGLGGGMLLGLIQGVLIARSGINPFIITLALLSTYKGIAAAITKGQSYQNLPDSFKIINKIKIVNIPITFVIAVFVCCAVFIIFRYLTIGKKLLACGENPKAAVFSGIDYPKTVITGHMLSGLLCGIAAVLQITRFGSAQLSVGDDWMLASFVVPVLGGTLLSGGKISVVGTLLGGVLMVFINNALILWGVSSYAFQTFIGIILLVAYEVDRTRVTVIKKQSRASVQKEAK